MTDGIVASDLAVLQPVEVRNRVLTRVQEDLIGPKMGDEETVDERPSARYLSGILYPQQSEFRPEEDDRVEAENGRDGPDDESENEASSMFRSFKPATCGFSFNVEASGAAQLYLTVQYGRYLMEEIPREGRARPAQIWKRAQRQFTNIPISLDDGSDSRELEVGLRLYRRVKRDGARSTVTIQFVNEYRDVEGSSASSDSELIVTDMIGREQACCFQFEANVSCGDGSRFVPRERAFKGNDDDEKVADLIYRDAEEYAVGHTASATWEPKAAPTHIHLTWMPTAIVQRMNTAGDKILSNAIATSPLKGLRAIDLYGASHDDLVATLSAICSGYAAWIEGERAHIAGLPRQLTGQATANLQRCVSAEERMREGVALIARDTMAEAAFRSANRAMYIQAAWASGRRGAHRDTVSADTFDFSWRPFQLAFALICLPSTFDRGHPDRDVFDLIWFPTGGGKTEAYLLLTAALLFHRRLRRKKKSGGVNVIMRYTLRTLTVQQFQRAAALITACEQMRLAEQEKFAGSRFSIGLWVGGDSTPNSFQQAVDALSASDPHSTPRQLVKCPVCKTDLIWEADRKRGRISCRCPDEECRRDRPNGELPVITVDDDIYAEPPSLLIGTVDKFAQIVRKSDTAAIFGLTENADPPDLIIQDELHLIGGPLGSLTGLYETAIDELCRTDDGPAKVVGSTATIRRADEQIRAVFDRRAFQFPPPAINWSNSCFASLDESDPGRLYVGLSTAGRSEKFALQALSASLLQAGMGAELCDAPAMDAYWTLVAYFNSLKVLGGALVLMEDDVRITLSALAAQRSEAIRALGTPEELTSRKASSEIPLTLAKMDLPKGDPECVDVLLASNMLSVGVDIQRLGLMLVNGQPKFMAEYIQATSRVGRREPGMVLTLYNNNKIRDRAHFETFASWHGALYRSVEPSSVTPFAPRARDKALHAPLVALVRHRLSPSGPGIRRGARPEIMALVQRILERVSHIDPSEIDAASEELTDFVDEWLDGVEAGRIKAYWNDTRFNSSLLMSAEKAAARRAAGKSEAAARSTPNSVRNVEPSVDFVLKERV